MKIAFAKVGASPKYFDYRHEEVRLHGTLKATDDPCCVVMEATLSGEHAMHCDRCGALYRMQINHPLQLRLSNTTLTSNEDLDIIEFLDGMIDIDYILQSETALLEGSFHWCDTCRKSEETLEIEL